ncbi:MAG: dienelactone hydrolase family protein [Micrococcus sp.]|nr:dienelactone hydrolase family protein [Micrococcus sp.]
MAQIILFHHARGLTEGVRRFAELIEAGGHTVHTPDLYDGRVFETVEEGVAFAKELGTSTITARGIETIMDYPQASVVAGISLGALPAHCAAQTIPAFRACLSISAALPLNAFAPLWPPHVALQVHLGERDPWAVDEDLPLARSYAATAEHPDRPADLFEYDTDAHLFMDNTDPGYSKALTDLCVSRIIELLA